MRSRKGLALAAFDHSARAVVKVKLQRSPSERATGKLRFSKLFASQCRVRGTAAWN